MKRLLVPSAAALLLGVVLPGRARAADCGALGRLALPDTTITAAEVVAAGQLRPPAAPPPEPSGGPPPRPPAGAGGPPGRGLDAIMRQPGMNLAGKTTDGPNPAFCRVAATLRPSADSDIRVEVWLPLSGWNGKYLGVGNFGWAGSLMTAGMLTGVEAGYAAASTDTGHDASAPDGQGGRFTLGHPEKLVDYAYRADHLMTVTAKAMVAAFYGTAPTHSYWIGCSLGGLEGLVEAKRYPEDYDGIVAGAPPNPIVDFNAEQLWGGWLTHRDPSLQMPRSRFTMLHAAVLRACASPVGTAQAFVEDPARCAFDPRQLLCRGTETADCLTAAQVGLVEKLYAGPVNPRTGQVIFPGPAQGAEGELSADGRPFTVALDLFRYAAFQNPNWDWTTMDWDRDVARANAILGPLMEVDADLRPFFARGGRLLMYIGWNDGHNPAQLIGYYANLLRRAGPQARDSARLFVIPGMGHCLGGQGCDTFDKLGTIDGWVNQEQIPDWIIAAKVASGTVVRTRPLCAYPAIAHYQGTGSMDDAASFTCTPG